MKQLILTVFAVLTLCFSASAQRFEFFGGYSYGSEVGKIPSFTAPYHTALCTNTHLHSRDSRGRNAMTLGVNVRVIGNLSLGLSWTGLNEGARPFGGYANSGVPDYVLQNTNTVLFSVKYDWFKLWKLNIYSRGGIGVVFLSDPKFDCYNEEWLDWRDGKPESGKRFAWQASLLGVEYKFLRHYGVFAEGGLGRQGALMAGVKVFL